MFYKDQNLITSFVVYKIYNAKLLRVLVLNWAGGEGLPALEGSGSCTPSPLGSACADAVTREFSVVECRQTRAGGRCALVNHQGHIYQRVIRYAIVAEDTR